MGPTIDWFPATVNGLQAAKAFVFALGGAEQITRADRPAAQRSDRPAA